MKKLLTIFLLLAMLVQAVPVLHFFDTDQPAPFALVDEDSTEKSKEGKTGLSFDAFFHLDDGSHCALLQPGVAFTLHRYLLPPKPYTEQVFPPPNIC